MGLITVYGPFAGGHQTTRSVHFTLPRTLPPSLSRGIKKLDLSTIRFRRFEDLTHLVCELPDLEELDCGPSFDSFPTVFSPTRRRPRTDRNKLRHVNILGATDGIPALMLYRSVYNAASFFSDNEIAVVLALLQPLHRSLSDFVVLYEYDLLNHSCSLGESLSYSLIVSSSIDEACHGSILPLDFEHSDSPGHTIVSLRIVRTLPRNRIILDVVVNCCDTEDEDLDSWTDEDLDRWTRFDIAFNKIGGLIHRTKCVFGFDDREKLIYFARNLLMEKMPSIFRRAAVHYSMFNSKTWEWFGASLGSEELTGIYSISLVFLNHADQFVMAHRYAKT